MTSVAIAAAIILAGHFLAITVVCILAARYIERKQRKIERQLEEIVHKWVDPGPDNSPSELAKVLDAMGAVVGSAAARTIMSSIAAERSHTARAANSMADEIQGAQNPILGLLTGGKRGKGAALQRLAEVLGPMLFRVPNNPGSNGGQESPRKQYKMEM